MSAPQTSSAQSHALEHDGTHTTHLEVRGLGCDGCRRKLEAALLAHARVRTAVVELHPGRPADVTVEHEPSLDRAELAGVVAAAGYKVVAQEPSGK